MFPAPGGFAMANGRMDRLLRFLRRAEWVRAGGLTDEQLLEGFVARREEAAFEALVRRHGPMVLAVCRRVLHNWHDAEDAFQATFLVLLRKAASVASRDRLGPWLHGVAYRTALKAAAGNAKRRAKERQSQPAPRPEGEADPGWQELQRLLDQEVDRLPDKYRAPLVLCDLEGKTRREAARLLGWPVGTVSTRVAAGRARLARRLARRTGGALPVGMLAAALSAAGSSASVPAPLVAGTVTVAGNMVYPGAAAGRIAARVAALTEGVMKAMLLSRLKVAAAVVLGLAVLGAGAGWVAERTLAAAPTGEAQRPKTEQPDRRNGRRAAQPFQRESRSGTRKTADREASPEEDKDTEKVREDLERKLREVRKEAARLLKLRGILEIEAAVKKLKRSRTYQDDQKALRGILEAVDNYRRKVLSEIPTDNIKKVS
jgi:RNA polymerase sigma factor (sigma-70 family)